MNGSNLNEAEEPGAPKDHHPSSDTNRGVLETDTDTVPNKVTVKHNLRIDVKPHNEAHKCNT